jgi:hypothetical protein
MSENSTKPTTIPVIVGIFFTLLTIFLIVYFPCPTQAQYSVFRIVLAIAIAGIAAVIPGFIHVRYKGLISAGGALAVFLVVLYVTDPKKGLINADCHDCFSQNLIFKTVDGNFASDLEGVVAIEIGNELQDVALESNGTAFVKCVDYINKDKQIKITLKANGWQFGNGTDTISVAFSGKNATVFIRRDRQLCCITGVVRDSLTGDLISNATVAVQGLTTETKNGWFEINIPESLQNNVQVIYISKEGYSTIHEEVYPSTKEQVSLKLTRKDYSR